MMSSNLHRRFKPLLLVLLSTALIPTRAFAPLYCSAPFSAARASGGARAPHSWSLPGRYRGATVGRAGRAGQTDPCGGLRMALSDVPYPAGVYDRGAAARYFAKRPVEVARRVVEIAVLAAPLLLAARWDRFQGTHLQNQEVRAAQLAQTLSSLGPSFIKVLQDRVAPFDPSQTLRLLQEGLSVSPAELKKMLPDLSSEPVAAASIGQVYRGRLADGRLVAVKVQRPGVAQQIACDLHILTLLVPRLQTLQMFAGVLDVDALVDEWGAGFVNELDYCKEAGHGTRFLATLEKSGLAGSVTAPQVVPEASSRTVLTTTWIDGIPIDEAPRADAGRLAGLALTAYLVMMLDSGILHCDPHPGNLLVATDPPPCILDWGLVLAVDPDIQVALVEYVTHLATNDRSAIPGDLVALKFVPAGRMAEVVEAGVVAVLEGVLADITAPGGLAKLDVNKLTATLVTLSMSFDGTFCIPTYFAYITRAFSILNAIGASSDPEFSMVFECLPYLAKRFATDESPRSKQALQRMLYGPAGDKPLDTALLASLAGGLGKYASFQAFQAPGPIVKGTRTLSSVPAVAEAATPVPPSNKDRGGSGARGDAASEAVKLLLAPQGNYVQEIVLEELARLLEAGVRDNVREAIENNPVARAATWTLQRQAELANRLGPAAILFPWLLPAQVAGRVGSFMDVSDADREALETARELGKLAAPFSEQLLATLRSAGRSGVNAETLSSLLAQVRELSPGASAAFERLTSILQRRASERLEALGLSAPSSRAALPPSTSSPPSLPSSKADPRRLGSVGSAEDTGPRRS
ncbi:ABC1 family-domain-containing protein [Baffinella frigidus]|nr:ABC1 family-domain-containing protein [Cryptophyta sp. CCMP2293]